MRTNDRDEDVLRAAFAELRSRDEQATPSFAHVLRPRTSGSRASLRVASPLVQIAAAAAVLVVAVLTYRVVARGGRLTVPDEVITLAAWRPATDVLLETPGQSLLRAGPKLGSSMLDTRSPGAQR